MKTLLSAAALTAAIILHAPAALASESFDLNGLVHTAKVDLDTAKADADAHGDVIASQCYAGIESYAEANPVQVQLPTVKGVASAFQVARDGVKLAEAGTGQGLPNELVLACGPLALDVQNDLGKAAAIGFNIFGLKIF